MSKAAGFNPDQPMLPFADEVVQLRPLEMIDWEKRLTLSRLVGALSADADLPGDYASRHDLAQAETTAIEHGLYIPTRDPRYRNAEQLVTLAREVTPIGSKVPPRNVGIVFPSDEFKLVARNPRDLAKHVKTGTRNANETAQDRDEVAQKVGRSAGHALESKIKAMNNLQNTMIDERQLLRSLFGDLKSNWRGHYKARNLDKKRKEVDEKIHETAEVATINLNIGTTAIKGLHKAIKYNLYGNWAQDTLVGNWRNYIVMAGRHTAAKIDRVVVSIEACQEELAIYAPFLDNA